VNDQTDHDNCGFCGTVCTGSSTCITGLCIHHVFVTSTQYPGNLGGLAGADTDCQTRAAVAGLPGIYFAWLSDDTNSALTRMTHPVEPYFLVDDATLVAASWTGLTSGALLHAIDQTETGGAPTTTATLCGGGVPIVYTDTAKGGGEQTAGSNCGNWSSSTATAVTWGSAAATNASWTDDCVGSGVNSCNGVDLASLYCIQQ
jgi:hypothetical protein